MKTLLDTNTWSSSLFEGNAAFAQRVSDGTLFIVSQVRPIDNSFVILKSNPVPPDTGPGWSFSQVVQYTFLELNESFDPVVAYDSGTGLLHIIGTQDNRGASTSTSQAFPADLIKFTFDTSTNILTGPTVLVTASYVREGYDICTIGSGYTFVATAVTSPLVIDQIETTVQVTGISISSGVLTVETAYGSPPVGNSFPIGAGIAFSGLQLGTFLNGITVTVTESDYFHFKANYNHPDYSQVSSPPLYESGFATWLPGNALLGFTIASGDAVFWPPYEFASSPLRSGPVYGSVSICSPSTLEAEIYFESHPKVISFQDQAFTVSMIMGSSIASPSGWSDPVLLTGFTGRYADNRLTVVPDGTSRTLSFVYYTQQSQVNSYVGNILLGHSGNVSSSPPQWSFATATGSTLKGSVLQAAVSIDQAHNASISYILSSVYNQRGVWSYADLTIKPEWQDSYAVNDTVDYWNIGYSCTSPMTSRGYWVQGNFNTNDIAAVPAYYQAQTTVTGNAENTDPTTDPTYGSPPQPYWALFSGTPFSSTKPWDPRVTYASGTVVLVPVYYLSLGMGIKIVPPQFDPINWALLQPPSLSPLFWSVTPMAWPLYAGMLDLTSLSIQNPLTYADLSLTWLRGTKSLLDDKTLWAVIGEANMGASGSPPLSDIPYYVSFFNVPPTASLSPSSGTVLRGTPFLLDASGTYDPDTGDTVAYSWSLVVPSSDASHVTLTPNGNTASLFVDRAIGGAEVSLSVSVVAVDSTGATVNHPPMTVSHISYNTVGSSVTVMVNVASLAINEQVLLYGIGATTFLNNAVVTVTAPLSSTAFTGTVQFSTLAQATVAHNVSTADTGYAIATPQFAVTGSPPASGLIVEFNPAPIIMMPSIPGVPRNSSVTIMPTITGANDPDDLTTYNWAQIAGTAMQTSGNNGPTLTFQTNGAEVTGEGLEWALTVNDGVNPPVTAFIFTDVIPYDFAVTDTLHLSRAYWPGDIASRNTVPSLSPPIGWDSLTVSGILTNLSNVKRATILLDSPPMYNNARYLIISPYSVIDYLDGDPSPVLRKMYLPSPGSNSPPAAPPLILDAVHTEEDYTLIIGNDGNLYRFSSAPLIETDNPDTVLDLNLLSSLTLTQTSKMFSTVSYAGNRVLVFSCPDGCLLLQVTSDTLKLLALLEISLSSQLLYGTSNVQFVRLSNVESIRSGQILIGTVDDSGKTYETLLDLSQNAIIGTWDKSKLVNQFVTTGEILFQPEDTYSGKPLSPALNPPTDNGPSPLMVGFELVGISWVQVRPDLCSGYVVQSSTNGGATWQVASVVSSGAVESVVISLKQGNTYFFRVQAVSLDGSSEFSNPVSIII
jgi:hypothetical protein